MAADREASSRLQAETATMRAEVAKMRSQPRVFQNSRCAAAPRASIHRAWPARGGGSGVSASGPCAAVPSAQRPPRRPRPPRRCAATGAPLELPVVHFLCGHSFNQRSLGDGDSECPLCAPEFRRVLEIRRSLRAGGLQQDRFFTELREAGDGFAVVAEHFGRGLMNMTQAAVAAELREGAPLL